MTIEIEKSGSDTFKVSVDDGTKTEHDVEVPTAYWQELTGGNVSKETLLRESFEFLLEREPNTSILSSFELSSINRYFPEYDKEIRRRV